MISCQNTPVRGDGPAIRRRRTKFAGRMRRFPSPPNPLGRRRHAILWQRKAFNTLLRAFSWRLNPFSTLLNAISGVLNVISGVLNLISKVLNVISSVLNVISKVLNVISGVLNLISSVLNMISGVLNMISGLLNAISGLLNAFSNAFLSSKSRKNGKKWRFWMKTGQRGVRWRFLTRGNGGGNARGTGRLDRTGRVVTRTKPWRDGFSRHWVHEFERGIGSPCASGAAAGFTDHAGGSRRRLILC